MLIYVQIKKSVPSYIFFLIIWGYVTKMFLYLYFTDGEAVSEKNVHLFKITFKVIVKIRLKIQFDYKIVYK